MANMFIFGLGYSAGHIRKAALTHGWQVAATGREGDVDFADRDAVKRAIERSSHILSSVPPSQNSDPVLDEYSDLLTGFSGWTGYLSSSGVYGDARGAWVDESSPTGRGRRQARSAADARWLALGARVFRLPGIYGPGRSMFERIASGKAHRIDIKGQVFSRIHVEDIASGVMAAALNSSPAGAYNLADDRPSPHNAVVEEACRILGKTPPPMQKLEEAGLSEMAKGFYAENRRIANGKAKRILGWQPKFPDFTAGLRAIWAAQS
ncbi:SDR family NAD(P)-dependent oxidoreductase [Altericroceibacterium spongiae]|uniref:SDR family NAD(P)-dependent oxidoreductase n=1 Tax=Altericroceibacterium spongiae TaxID=2320269 RepID=A0A420EIP5_9SPHN|nr:SDR family NAD(P)-dependent oxidoreductase [Altericroceibacterium spongiae]RKF20527.1 SDR family NAD(P)-dependent oxidoreductase [Altericroceibacterium spongiae]